MLKNIIHDISKQKENIDYKFVIFHFSKEKCYLHIERHYVDLEREREVISIDREKIVNPPFLYLFLSFYVYMISIMFKYF